MWLNLGVNQLANYLNAKPMLNLTIYDFFWGYDDNLIELANNLIPSWITFEKLGVLDRVSTKHKLTMARKHFVLYLFHFPVV